MLAKKPLFVVVFIGNAQFSGGLTVYSKKFTWPKWCDALTCQSASSTWSSMVFTVATHNVAIVKDALYLKAVCSNPRHKREKFVTVYLHQGWTSRAERHFEPHYGWGAEM